MRTPTLIDKNLCPALRERHDPSSFSLPMSPPSSPLEPRCPQLFPRRFWVSVWILCVLVFAGWCGAADAASISGTVTLDDGTGAARPVRAAVVRLRDTGSGSLVESKLTSVDGGYAFSGVVDGAYAVELLKPDGASLLSEADGTPDGAQAVTVAGSDVVSQNFVFGSLPLFSVGGKVRHDSDANSAVSSGDAFVDGATVNLYRDLDGDSASDVGELVASVVTGARGVYEFTDLPRGDYLVTVDRSGFLSGASFVIPSEGVLSVADLQASASEKDLLVGGMSAYGISGIVRHRSTDLTLAPVPFVQVRLFRDSNADQQPAEGEQIATTRTLVDGSYSFSGLLDGAYVAVLDLPAGAQVADSGSSSMVLTVSGAALSGRNFLLSGLVVRTISGAVSHSPSEVKLPGVEVKLYSDTNEDGVAASGEKVATTRTGVDGTYRFEKLFPGSYLLVVTAPSSAQVSGAAQLSASVAAADVGGKDFVFTGSILRAIRGRVLTDVNRDGVVSATDTAFAGATLRLHRDLDQDGAIDAGELFATTQSGADGTFAFTNVPEGGYVLQEGSTGRVTAWDSDGGNDGRIRIALSGADREGCVFLGLALNAAAPSLAPIARVTSATQGVAPITPGTAFTTSGGGTLLLNADGSYSYTPPKGTGSLTETFTYFAATGDDRPVQQTLTLTVVRGTAARTGQLLVTRVPVAKAVTVPINASQPGGRPLTYTVTSSNPKIMARVKTGNPYLKLTVSYAGDTNAAAFRGEMLLQLFRDMAPMTVGNIAGLAQAGFYDGLHFHRIVPGFVLQGGDPNSRDLTHPELWGQGGPGFTFDNEFNPSLIFTGRGQLAMANSGMPLLSATNGSQFFITTASPRHLDFKHTVFGQLVRGFDIMRLCEEAPLRDTQNPGYVPVFIERAEVVEDSQDAVLILSATTNGSAIVSVQVKDGTVLSEKRTFAVDAVVDAFNSPTFMTSPGGQVAVPGQEVDFRMSAVDLEFDYPDFLHFLFDNAENRFQSGQDRNLIGVVGGPGVKGPVDVGVLVRGRSMSVRGWRASDFFDDKGVVGSVSYNSIQSTEAPVYFQDSAVVRVGVGGASISGTSERVEGVAGTAITSGVVASFSLNDLRASATTLSAKINWGDGTPVVDASSVRRDPRSPGLGKMAVFGTHTYSKPGFYQMTVEVRDNNGLSRKIYSEALVAPAARTSGLQPIFVRPQVLQTSGAALTERVVATFRDGRPQAVAAYEALVNWGDGTWSKGRIVGNGNGLFSVFASHTYADPELFPTTVRIKRTVGVAVEEASGFGFVRATGFTAAPHLPPFAQARLVAWWNAPLLKTTSGNQSLLGGVLTIFNSGSAASKPALVRFYYSPDASLPNTAPLGIGPFTEAGVPALPAGNAVSYSLVNGANADFRLKLPAGNLCTGGNVLVQLLYNDPIADLEPIEKVLVSGPINGIQHGTGSTAFDPASGIKIALGSASSAATSASFQVRLDAAPAATVDVPVSCTQAGRVKFFVVGTEVTKLTFTAANWSTWQSLTITSQDTSAANYSIRLGPAQSTDAKFDRMQAGDLPVTNP